MLLALIGLPLLIVGLVLIVGQTSAMKRIVEPILGSQLGLEVRTGSVKLGTNGKIVIRDAVFSSESIDGDAGDLIEIERAMINLDLGSILRGGLQISSIEIDRPLVRVSQDIETGRVNFAELEFKQDGGGGPMPAIVLRNGMLEIGEHQGSDYRVLKTLALQGRIEKQSPDGTSAFALLAMPTEAGMSDPGTPPARGVIQLTGELSPDGVRGQLDGLRLQDWPSAYVPSRSRAMYERLALTGELAPTRLSIDADGEARVTLTLDGVSLNLPFDDTGSITGPGDLLRMRQTRGTVTFGTLGLRADLKGLIDALEYDVELDYQGLDAQSPFSAMLSTEFRLDERFKPAKFLPENVISKLQRFERPAADVGAIVRIERERGMPVRVSGRASFSNGSAVYSKFRYPFAKLEGVLSFDPDKLVIERITGVGPSGARLQADGVFAPLGEDSIVTLNLRVDDVPVDRVLLDALNQEQRELVSALFNEEDYQRLLDEGLLLRASDRVSMGDMRRALWDRLDAWRDGIDGLASEREALADELSRIDRRLNVPDFDFGGKADVSVLLRRHPERHEDHRWTTQVRVMLPEAGLVPGNFPLPIVARDVEITIDDERVELTGGQYIGLGGGTAQVSAIIDRQTPDAKPIVTISADAIPIDQRLVAAIPGYYARQSDDPEDISLRRILDRLRLGGVVECEATIGPRGDNRVGYDVEATITRGFARPIYQGFDAPDDPLTVRPGSDPLALDDLYGTVYVTEELIIVDLTGTLSSPDMPIAPTPISVLTQLTLPGKQRGMGGVRRESGLLPTDFGPPVPGPAIFALARGDGLDLSMPLQHAVAVVSPRIARDLLGYDAQYRPDGVLAVDAKLEGFVGGGVESSFTLDRIESLAFDLGPTHYQIGASWGSASLMLGSSPAIAFDAFRVPLSNDGQDAGTLSLDGVLPLTRPGQLIELESPSGLRTAYENGSFDSALAQLVVGQFGSENARAWLDDNQLGGRFDLDVTLTPEAGVHRVPSNAVGLGMLPMTVYGELLPRSLSLRIDGSPAIFDQVEGSVRFEGYSGRFDRLRAVASDSEIAVDGHWELHSGRGLDMELMVDASGALLTGPVRAILPEPIDRVIDGLEIKAQGGVSVDGMRISTHALGTDTGMYDIRGRAQINQGSAVIGLPITGLAGGLSFAVRGAGGTLGYEMELDAQRFRAGLMRAYDARVQIIGDANNPGVVLIPEIIAGMHGGRIAGSAQIRPDDEGVQNYWMELHASGVRAAPVFDDLLLPPEGLVGPPLPGQDAVLSSWSKAEDLSRGALIADLTLTGPVGDQMQRVGRGTVQIKGGSVLALPGLINLIEVSNLSLPTGATIDLAQTDFYIDGPILAFEQISASSRKIEILGYGTLNWQNRGVDLRFRSRAINPIPIVSQLFETLRDELITTRVTGTLDQLEYSVSQFSETRQLFNALIGHPMSEQEVSMREVREQVQRDRNRVRRSTSDEIHRPSLQDSGRADWGVSDTKARSDSPPISDQQP